MDRLDDHNGVVHHDCNSQHQGKQGQQVDREPEQVQEEECSDQRHNYRDGRYEGRAEVLQEDIYYDEHQNKGFDDGLDHFVDRGKQEVCRVHQHDVFDAFRKTLRKVVQRFFDALYDLGGVGSGDLVDRHHHGRIALCPGTDRIVQTAEFYPGNILQS